MGVKFSVVHFLGCLGFLLVALSGGCGWNTGERPQPAREAPAAVAARPSLPAPSELPKAVSASPERVRYGGWYEQLAPYTYQNVAPFSARGQFTPDYDTNQDPPHTAFAYAMYRFNFAGLSGQPAEVRSEWFSAPADFTKLWWGLANWERDRWDWFAADGASPQALPAPSMEPYLAEDGRVVLCVLLLGTAPADLSWVAAGGNLPPQASCEIDPETPQAGEPVAFSAISTLDYDGTIAKFEYDFGEGAGFEDYGANPDATHTYNTAGQYTTYLRVTDSGGLTDTDSLVIDVGELPHGVIASLAADPPSGSPILAVQLDASGSVPSTGATITSYAFDFDGDGTQDQIGPEAVVFHTYQWGGTYPVTVTVTDDAAQSDTATFNLQLDDTRTWQTTFSSDCGATFALVEAGGRPGLAFNTSDRNQLYFVRAKDAAGAAWQTPMLVDIMGPFDGRMEAELIDGKPTVVCIRSVTDEDLYVRYLHSLDNTGMIDGYWSAVDVAPMGYLDRNQQLLDLVPVGSGAGIAYLHRTPDEIRFIRSNDASGNTWNSPVKVVASDLLGTNSISACILDGKPAVAYSEYISGGYYAVYYKQATDVLGGAFGTAVAALDVNNRAYGQNSLCIAQIGGVLGLLADYSNSGEANYAYPDPENPGTFAKLNPCRWGFNPSYEGMWTTLAGHPVLVGWDYRDNAAYLTRASNRVGTVWPTSTDPQTVVAGDPDGTDTGRYPKLLVLQGVPVVAYYDAGAQQVHVAVLK